MIISPDCEVLANAQNEKCAIFADKDLNIVKNYKINYPISEID